ncbi:unnamed protein product [Amoebophrya sp. A120]|nr:unnamed protein product [Amoebophrya sp. A120]|eukprot:GSA120T00002349001.1
MMKQADVEVDQDDDRQSSSSVDHIELQRQMSQPSQQTLELLQDLATQYNDLVERTNEIEAEFRAGQVTTGKATTDLSQIEAAANKLQEKGVDSVQIAELHSGKETARALRRSLNAGLESFFERLSDLFRDLRAAKTVEQNAADQAHANLSHKPRVRKNVRSPKLASPVLFPEEAAAGAPGAATSTEGVGTTSERTPRRQTGQDAAEEPLRRREVNVHPGRVGRDTAFPDRPDPYSDPLEEEPDAPDHALGHAARGALRGERPREMPHFPPRTRGPPHERKRADRSREFLENDEDEDQDFSHQHDNLERQRRLREAAAQQEYDRRRRRYIEQQRRAREQDPFGMFGPWGGLDPYRGRGFFGF